MKIIVLAGGLSTERDVSLVSAAGICRTLLEKGHDAFLLDVFMGLPEAPENLEDVFTMPGHGLEIAGNISREEPDLEAVKASRPDQSDCFLGPNVIELCRLADITFLGLHGGEGENGKLQATFDLLGIRYTGPDSLGCAVAMDKGFTKQVFLQSGIDTPDGVCLHKNDPKQDLASLGLRLPVVVKPCSGGSSIGVSIVANKVPGVRCAHCHDTYSAKYTRLHNDANMLAFGQKIIGEGLMLEIVDTFLNTDFEGGRHQRRVDMLNEM